MSGETTDTGDGIPWETDRIGAIDDAPHLVIAWSLEEPARVGEAALIDSMSVLGRGTVVEGSEHSRVVFQRQRPAGLRPTPAPGGPGASRESS